MSFEQGDEGGCRVARVPHQVVVVVARKVRLRERCPTAGLLLPGNLVTDDLVLFDLTKIDRQESRLLRVEERNGKAFGVVENQLKILDLGPKIPGQHLRRSD